MANSNSPEIEPLSRTQILVVMGVTAIILLTIVKVWQKFSSVRLLPVEFNSQALLWGLGTAASIIISSSIIYRIWPAYRRSAEAYLKLIIKPLIWGDLIWLGLLPGLSEELLFRGMMLPAFGFNWTALIVSSLLFGVLHLSGASQWSYVVWATVVGFVLGYCTLITGNLLVPIIAHVITNFLSSCLWKVNYGKQAMEGE
ncbi:CPBP family intramembrane glutamic endopeptidase [Myxosarcina sp. GI1]|uniref:CPBP family intramembrane glutamic endopeptidase n=1 Tax=Myxosarcina sp. GI1 TaxID=1541065 RepID=UPI00055DCE1D|nr:CPBP family intramembrane glutamic endopeptidase [Myxosarcina sp. GI1]